MQVGCACDAAFLDRRYVNGCAGMRRQGHHIIETSCAAGAPLRMTTVNGGQKIL